MQIYLPIAEMSVDIFLILGLGALTGVLSGLFGVGGGFLMTPLLIFIGVSPAVAVSSSANQIIASSVSGFMAHWRKRNVDIKMGVFLMTGGLFGSLIGVSLFAQLQRVGQIDLVIALCYVFFLGAIGLSMAIESLLSIRGRNVPRKPKDDTKLRFPVLVVHFPASGRDMSMLIPIAIGMVVGVLVSIMGIGGGFFMIPAMIYLLRMPAHLVVGTSLFQIIFVTANVTFMQAMTTKTVDVILALLLIVGAVVGAQIGTRLGGKLPAEYMRGLLALIVLGVALRLSLDLFVTPADPYEVQLELNEDAGKRI